MRNLWQPLGHNGIIWIRILKAAPINQSWNFPMNYLNQFQKKKKRKSKLEIIEICPSSSEIGMAEGESENRVRKH